MREAFAAGIRFLEIDLAASADGKLFLLHDDTLERTTTAVGKIGEQSAAALVEATLRGTGERLPGFEDALVWARQTNAWLMLDLKEAPPGPVLAAVHKARMVEDVVVLTFSRDRAAAVAHADDVVPISVLVPDLITWRDYQRSIPHPARLIAYVPQTAPAEVFMALREQQVCILTDALRNTDDRAAAEGPEVYREFMRTRTPAIVVTDRPLALRAAMQE